MITNFNDFLNENKKRWTDSDIEYLKKNHVNMSNQELSNNLNRTYQSVLAKSSSLSLKKSPELISKNSITSNKNRGRDLSYDFCKEIALSCKTPTELKNKDGSVYSSICKNKWLDEMCKHMVKQTGSYPQKLLERIIKQLFDDEDVVVDDNKTLKDEKTNTKLELDIYLPKYKLAFEYDGKKWHIDNKNDIIKNKLCKDKGITLIRIIQDNLPYAKSIKNQLINNLNIINRKCNTFFTDIDINEADVIVENDILSDTELKELISGYENVYDFRTNNNLLYNKLVKTNRLHYLNDLENQRKRWTDKEINYLMDNIDKLSIKEISEYLKMTPLRIQSKLKYIRKDIKNKKEI